MFNNTASIILLSIAILLCSSPSQANVELAFGVYTSNKPTTMLAKFRPVLDVIEKNLSQLLGENTSITMKIARSYEAGRNHLLEKEVDFSRLGAVSYVLVKQQQPQLSILAVESNKGQPYFSGIIATHLDSDLNSVEQLAGRSFAFGNQTSTIGRYLSQLHLVEHGITQKKLSSFEYLGRHDKVGAMIAAKQFDAGALNEKAFKKLQQKDNKLKPLASFSAPTKAWVARAGLPARIKLALSQVLLELNEQEALQAFKYQGFLPATDSHYDSVRQAIQRNPEFFNE